MTGKTQRKPFTGWHMTAIMVVFFGVVVAVNFTMAHLAMDSFGGTVVDNSYVASQNYNKWLANAEAQKELGWNEKIALDEGRVVTVGITKGHQQLNELKVAATLSHPLGRAEPVALNFISDASGKLRSATAIPQGRWRLDMSVRHNSDIARYSVELK